MDGSGAVLGHDLQFLPELARQSALWEAGVFFRPAELARIRQSSQPLSRLGGFFSAKEAFYKAMPNVVSWDWIDIEVAHRDTGQPILRAHNGLATWLRAHNLMVRVSISHSGDYASATVLILEGDADVAGF